MGYIEELAEYKADWMNFAELSPDVIEGFGQVRGATCQEGKAVDFKTIELVSVAVAVARKCKPCMLAHVQVCVDLGVTREELAAALNPCIMLCGGPGWAYASMALAAFDEMSAAK